MPLKDSLPVPEILAPLSAQPTAEAFNVDRLRTFYERSISEETRRAYKRVVKEFFRFIGDRHPAEISPADIIRWRDILMTSKRSASTVSFKLSVIRSMFDYLKLGGYVVHNPAMTKLVPPPAVPEDLRGRALAPKEVRYLLSGPDRSTVLGARDYALLLLMLKTSIRVSEACSLRSSSIRWSHGRWVLTFKVKGGRTRSMPCPAEVKTAIDEYLKLDRSRRSMLKTDGGDASIFQPLKNHRTLVHDKSITTALAWQIVKRWGEFTGVGKLSPHDLRRTAITKALDQGLTYRQVQMMTGHKDPKTVMKYDHGRENMDQNAVNFLDYSDD
jgi:integrase/recombinase XerD